MEENSLTQEEAKEQFDRVASETVKGMAPAVQPVTVMKGRQRIMTNYLSSSQVSPNMYGYEVLNKDNIVDALNVALPIHRQNAKEIDILMKYAKGDQPILYGLKDIRPDVDNKVVIDYAGTFTRDIVGYTFGKPMQYIGRRTDDNGDDTIKEEIRLLNDYAEMADKQASDQVKAVNCSISGIAHRGIFVNKNDDDDEAPYKYYDMDSRCTFVAYNSQNNEEAFACNYVTTEGLNPYTIYTVYTKDEIYMFKTPYRDTYSIDRADMVRGYPQKNPLGLIPIVECDNNQFMMGHWESALTLLDAINTVASNSVNDVEQFVNSILVAVNAEFTEDTMNTIRTEKYAEISSPQGLPADLKYINGQLDGSSVELLRQYLEDCLRAVVGIPDRKTRGGGGGDTGDAVKLRDGWADMEVVARTTETFNKKSEKKELRIILKILKSLKKISKTSMINVDIRCPRNKNDNLNNKVNSLSTMLHTEIMAPEDALDIVDITSDIPEVLARGEIYWQKRKDKEFEDQRKQLELQGRFGGTQEGGNVNVANKPNINESGSNDSGKPKPKSKPDKR